MRRRDFFKKIGAATAVAVVAPTILAESPAKINSTVSREAVYNEGMFAKMQKGNVHQYEGLTKEHIKQAVEYVFRPSGMPERHVKFKVRSMEAVKEFNDLLKKEIEKQTRIAA